MYLVILFQIVVCSDLLWSMFTKTMQDLDVNGRNCEAIKKASEIGWVQGSYFQWEFQKILISVYMWIKWKHILGPQLMAIWLSISENSSFVVYGNKLKTGKYLDSSKVIKVFSCKGQLCQHIVNFVRILIFLESTGGTSKFSFLTAWE